jgi:hypothetical protein
MCEDRTMGALYPILLHVWGNDRRDNPLLQLITLPTKLTGNFYASLHVISILNRSYGG